MSAAAAARSSGSTFIPMKVTSSVITVHSEVANSSTAMSVRVSMRKRSGSSWRKATISGCWNPRVGSLGLVAMGLVLILALMVRNYIQGTLRSELAARGETLPHPFTKK